MTPDELVEIINLGVGKWHEVAKDHDFPACNCFRVAFAQVLIDKYGFSEEEMVAAWGRDLDFTLFLKANGLGNLL